MIKPILVLRFGSAVLAGTDGKISAAAIRKIAEEAANISCSNKREHWLISMQLPPIEYV